MLYNDNKRYYTLNNYLQAKFGCKVFKVSLNAGFTCPNIDGKVGYGGCIYCKNGSKSYGSDINDLVAQFNEVKDKVSKKWPNSKYIAYFQANTNTYDTLENLKKRYEQLVSENYLYNENIKVLSIATRPDCLNEEIVKYLASLKKKIDVWVELGFQTMHHSTAILINRGYDNIKLEQAVSLLKKYHITTIVHIINGLPYETKDRMIETVKYLNNLKIDGIKIHMLHIMKDTPLATMYANNPFHILTLNEYVDIVVNQLRYLDENIVIHRLTGDAPKDLLIEPTWTLKKFVVLNEIDKYMRKNNIYQGDLCLK